MEEYSVKIMKKGGWLFIQNYDIVPRIKEILSYNHKHTLYEYGKCTVFVTKKECFQEEKANDGSKILIARSGFLHRIRKFLESNNIRYFVQELDEEISSIDVSIDNVATWLPRLRERQKKCLEAILTNNNGIIIAPPGFGKSFLIPIICDIFYKAKIDIITKRKEVCKRILSEFKKSETDVGLVTSGSKRAKKRVTIYTAGSLNYSDYDADIIIVDECHELATDNYRKLMMRYNPKRSYAFSATVNKRADNADFLIEEIFGPVIFEARYNEAVIEKSVVPIRIIWYRCDSTVTLFKFNGDIYEYKKNRIWRNDQRNRKIAEIANQFVKNNKQVLILVDTIEHALNIERFDNEMIVCCRQPDSTRLKRLKSRGLNVDKIVNSAEEFEKMIENFRSRKIMKMVATDVLSTGVSFEDLEVLIRADAKASKIFSVQAPGRVSRNSNSVRKETGIVVDLYDSKDKLSMKYAKERYKQYKEVGWSQEDSDGNSVSAIFESKTLHRYNKQRKSS